MSRRHLSAAAGVLFAAVAGLSLLTGIPAARADFVLGRPSEMGKALAGNDMDLLRSALTRGESPNGPDGQGRTPLMLALTTGTTPMIKLLLENRANTNSVDKLGDTPLHYAARRGDASFIPLLLAKGAKVNQENKQGLTPLMEAARSGAPDVVDRLIKAGARADAVDYSGRSVLDWGTEGRNARILSLLRAAGAK